MQVRDQASELIKQGYVIILWCIIGGLNVPLSKIFCGLILLTVERVHARARL